MTEKIMEASPYASKIWLKSYDAHAKPEVPLEPFTLVEMLKNVVAQYPDSLCYDFQGSCATYKEFMGLVNSFANFLIQNGVQKGDRVVINLPNLPQFIVSLFGTFTAGCAVTGMNFLLSPSEINYQLKDSGATVIVTLDSLYEEKVKEGIELGNTNLKIIITANAADMLDLEPEMKQQLFKIGKIPFGKVDKLDGFLYSTFPEIIKTYSKASTPDISIGYDDVLLLQYTGGTTGPPKGAILTHRNLSSLVQIVNNWFEPALKPGNNVYMSGFPFFHLAGLQFCIQTVSQACAQVLVPDPRDTNYMCSKLKEYEGRIGLLYNVPTLYLMLYNNRKFKKIDLSSVEGYISGAAPFPSKNIHEFEEVVGEGKVVEAYGMTEASPGVTMNPYIGKKKIGTVGVPFPNTELKLVDVFDRSKEVAIGEPGEIVIRGPQIFQGYWNKPEETKSALQDGWFFSGDVGIMDGDGYLTIVDRTKDMINVSGFKVFSVEVDEKMNKHPAIELCASVGIPDPDRPGSEFVRLYVQLKKGYEANEETRNSILKFAQENLAKYKIPKEITLTEILPLTAVGKVDKKLLRKS